MPIPEEARHLPASMDDAMQSPEAAKRGTNCFGCGPTNPQGLHLKFVIDAADLTATAPVNLTRLHEGPPGYIHGGIIATLLDEAMSKLNRPLEVLAVTRNMQVDYLRPSPLNQPLTLIGRHLRREGRKLYHQAELTTAEGTILAQATGLFLVVDPAVLKRL
ncbi:PaaI family thioesterase [Granulicella arctica]|uniref:Acyl-coenzyme A thioesterase THEM4 n=1 Tax=Granulicella arctica TaxID=940613 RepID=A0A7Y9PHY4_9BACT|nr:PaaI family thioesterase [Granulicella arctica]NYF80255.1 uncharacterized protein (TIGR00369 family) [Granulicella arctica]